MNSTATWNVNVGPSDWAANFFFDYSTIGIPPAPGGPGTRGMKLQANLNGGVFSGLSVSPVGLNLSGDYIVTFDLWANFNGPFPGGGNGSTNLSTFGIGTAGTTAQWPGAGATTDSVWFGATGDGGSASDYRAYSTAAPTSYPSGSSVYAAPSTNNTHPYYDGFGGVMAPAAQLAMFPQQTGSTAIGSAGMQWHRVAIRKSGNLVTWRINGLLIATIDLNTVTLGGGNIFFGHSDINAGSSTDPNDVNLLFTLFDNIVVFGDMPGGFNVDIGTALAGSPGFGAPSGVFSAAAGQPGIWNSFVGTGAGPLPLVSLDGAVTGVTLSRDNGAGGNFAVNNPNTTLNVERLLDDAQDIGGVGQSRTYTFIGLPPGNYTVFTYAIAPDDSSFRTNIAVPGSPSPNPQTIGGVMPMNAFEHGVTHARHLRTIAAGERLTIIATTAVGFGTINGIQLLPGPLCPPADLNGDCIVNGLDLGILLINWSIPPGSPGCGGAMPCPSDLNGDGQVNGLDLGILLASWTI